MMIIDFDLDTLVHINYFHSYSVKTNLNNYFFCIRVTINIYAISIIRLTAHTTL